MPVRASAPRILGWRRRSDCSPGTQIDRSTIDFLLLCTQTPDYPLPTTACLMQERLGLPTSIGALDFNLGCSGFVYGLSLADGLIRSGTARRVLLITAENKYVTERRCRKKKERIASLP